MAQLVVTMNVSLDGYVDHDRFAPDPALFARWIEVVRGLSAGIYGRVTYDLMRYWDTEDPGWSPSHRAFAEAWRALPKWVVARADAPLGPGAPRVTGDVAEAVAALKAGLDGEVQVGGPMLAETLAGAGLVDEYRLYLHPLALGHGAPLFRGPRPAMRLLGMERFGEVVRLGYAPLPDPLPHPPAPS